MTSRLGLAVVGALAAVSCAADDPVGDGLEIRTTVPSVTTPAPSSTSSTSAPSSTPAPSSTTVPATTLPPSTTLPAGDVTAAAIELELVVELDQPIDAVVAPNGEWWIAQRSGEVVVVDPASGAVGDMVLDIADETRATGERGLLGIAVDADAVYVNFTDSGGDTQIDAYLLDPTGRPADRFSLLTIEQPFSNHNGGGMAIGPDGLLYIGVGDGGNGGDPLGAGQDPAQILGAILRIDPAPGSEPAYVIPPDNPFADGGGVPEIFLTGVRNPWRFAFDPVTNDLWVADVGQNAWEEITLLLGANGWGLGANLGWNLREGIERFEGERPPGNVDPVFVYGRSGPVSGCSITGGEVYRGSSIPALVGAFVFGDYCTSEIWAVSVSTGEVVFADLGQAMPGANLAAFSVDPGGEIVAMSLSGAVVRLVGS